MKTVITVRTVAWWCCLVAAGVAAMCLWSDMQAPKPLTPDVFTRSQDGYDLGDQAELRRQNAEADRDLKLEPNDD